MSGRYGNPFFTDPGLAQGFSSLAAAFMPNPNTEAQIANARFAGARTAQIERGLTAAQTASDRLRTAPNADPSTIAPLFADILASADPALIQQLPAFMRGFGGAIGASPERVAQLFVGAGGDYANTQPGFERTDQTRRRGQDVSAGATLGAARIGADASRDVANINQAGQDRRFTTTARPGDIVTLPENSPIARPGQQGPVTLRGDERPQTLDQARAAQVAPFLNPPAGEDPAVATRRRELLNPQIVSAETRVAGANAPGVNGADVRAINDQIVAQLEDGTALDTAAAAFVRNRAAELMQQPGPTRDNIPLAVRAALEEFRAAGPPRTDSRLNPFSNRTYGVPQRTAPAAPTAPPPPAPRDGAAAVPPPAQRQVNRIYDTPRGPMVWTGTGWVPAQ